MSVFVLYYYRWKQSMVHQMSICFKLKLVIKTLDMGLLPSPCSVRDVLFRTLFFDDSDLIFFYFLLFLMWFFTFSSIVFRWLDLLRCSVAKKCFYFYYYSLTWFETPTLAVLMYSVFGGKIVFISILSIYPRK